MAGGHDADPDGLHGVQDGEEALAGDGERDPHAGAPEGGRDELGHGGRIDVGGLRFDRGLRFDAGGFSLDLRLRFRVSGLSLGRGIRFRVSGLGLRLGRLRIERLLLDRLWLGLHGRALGSDVRLRCERLLQDQGVVGG